MLDTATRIIREALKAAGDWAFDAVSRRYRDVRSGQFLSASTSVELRNDVLARTRMEAANTTDRLIGGRITVSEWERAMRTQVRESYATQFAFGRGGRDAMTRDDRKALGKLIDEQHAYLRDFAGAIADGELSGGQIAARAAMYLNGSAGAYERGHGAAYGMPELDHYPGDGSTQCLSNCLCSLEIEPTDGGWDVTWVLGDPATESCDDCVGLASDWDPLFVAAGD